MKIIDAVGQRFGLLTVRAILPASMYLCDCECGTKNYRVAGYSVRKGLCKSCGCCRFGHHVVHGESRKGSWSTEYCAWVNMLTRCYNHKSTRFKDWGGRGIKVCDRWKNSFTDFLSDVGRKPTRAHSLDRFPDCNGNYEPGNVRWATRSQQASNTRKTLAAKARREHAA